MSNYSISIAGNIGVGKTTLVRLIAEQWGWTPLYEEFDNNPWLESFYDDMEQWAFHCQMHFLQNRAQQGRQAKALLKRENIILDRSIYEDAHIFAANLRAERFLSEAEWALYFYFYDLTLDALSPPDLIVHLSASVDTLLERIQKRDREMEHGISTSYLSQLNAAYETWVSTFTQCPILTIDTNDLNFVKQEEHLEQILTLIEEKLPLKSEVAPKQSNHNYWGRSLIITDKVQSCR